MCKDRQNDWSSFLSFLPLENEFKEIKGVRNDSPLLEIERCTLTSLSVLLNALWNMEYYL